MTLKEQGISLIKKTIKSFDDLSPDEKKEFLNYSVSVKDLKDIGETNTKEVFKRINSTDYSLNSNEILNAQYGGGEFAIFCKLLADNDYNPTDKETDIIIKVEIREIVTLFFKKNNIFSENDIKRMFDSHYFMLITSTLLEGKYFGRNLKINSYLDKYNSEFGMYQEILKKLINSITIINKLRFSENSYWFNKANLFTLLFELSDVIEINLDLEKLEQNLIDLENKVDIYFNGDENEIKLLTQDETKYFEVSRQGSHEFSAREHRGNVVKDLINKSLKIESEIESIENIHSKNLILLKQKKKNFSVLIPTTTGLAKSIMDATSTVRDFLQKNDIHDYSTQEFGPLNKVKIKGFLVNQGPTKIETEVSLYRSNGRGDFRIWFTGLKEFGDANNELAMININGEINILNISKYDYTDFIQGLD